MQKGRIVPEQRTETGANRTATHLAHQTNNANTEEASPLPLRELTTGKLADLIEKSFSAATNGANAIIRQKNLARKIID